MRSDNGSDGVFLFLILLSPEAKSRWRLWDILWLCGLSFINTYGQHLFLRLGELNSAPNSRHNTPRTPAVLFISMLPSVLVPRVLWSCYRFVALLGKPHFQSGSNAPQHSPWASRRPSLELRYRQQSRGVGHNHDPAKPDLPPCERRRWWHSSGGRFEAVQRRVRYAVSERGNHRADSWRQHSLFARRPSLVALQGAHVYQYLV